MQSGLIRLFTAQAGRLIDTMDAETVRGEAAEILSTLIESVKTYPEGRYGPEVEVVPKATDLMAFATDTSPLMGYLARLPRHDRARRAVVHRLFPLLRATIA